MWLQAVMLHEQPAADDRSPPAVTIRYPVADLPTVGAADAIVVDVCDDRSVTAVELLIDGIESGHVVEVDRGMGRVVLPLLTRALDAGPHTFEVRCRDVDNNIGASGPRPFIVSKDPAAEPTPYDRAIRLLDRFAFGPDPRELAAILTMGEQAWLSDRLARSIEDEGDLSAFDTGLVRFPGVRSEYEVPRRVLVHAMMTPNPVRARFVLWTQNHFSTWIRKTEPDRKWAEHGMFTRLGAAPFIELLAASAGSPAMLRYLDQEQSYAGRLNENYARELMELHTLGVNGGYTQQDVTSLASLLTGWTTTRQGDGRSPGEIYDYSFAFDPALSDGRTQNIIGMRFPAAERTERYDRVRLALETLAAHPSTARFVTGKLAAHYAGPDAAPAMIDDLARVYLETGGDMRAVLLAIARHPAFWSSPDRLAHPLDYALRLCRASSHFDPWGMGDYLQRSGAGLFDRATPDGFPEEDSAYADSNALVQRWRYARDLVWSLSGLVPGPWRYNNNELTPARAQRIVDILAVRMTGRVLGDASNKAALDVLAAAAGNNDERVRQLATFIPQLPESNLR